MSTAIQLFLVDDHTVIRQALKTMLELDGEFRVIGEASTCGSAEQDPELSKADVVILDLNLAQGDGLALLATLRSRSTLPRILIFSMHSDADSVTRAFQIGADGFLPKTATRWELAYAIRSLHEGGSYVHPGLTQFLVARMNRAAASDEQSLTSKEQEVLSSVGEGLGPAAIADRCCISVNTVKTHMRSIYRKLGATNRTEALLKAAERGLVRPNQRLR